jgi:hypothetical protein
LRIVSLLGLRNMKAFIIQFPYGVAAFDDKNSLVDLQTCK